MLKVFVFPLLIFAELGTTMEIVLLAMLDIIFKMVNANLLLILKLLLNKDVLNGIGKTLSAYNAQKDGSELMIFVFQFLMNVELLMLMELVLAAIEVML